MLYLAVAISVQDSCFLLLGKTGGGQTREQVVSVCWTLTAPGHWCTDGPVDYQSEGNYPVVVGWETTQVQEGMRPDSPASHLPGFSQWVWGVDDCYWRLVPGTGSGQAVTHPRPSLHQRLVPWQQGRVPMAGQGVVTEFPCYWVHNGRGVEAGHDLLELPTLSGLVVFLSSHLYRPTTGLFPSLLLLSYKILTIQ